MDGKVKQMGTKDTAAQGRQMTPAQLVVSEADTLQKAIADAIEKGELAEGDDGVIFEQGLKFLLSMSLFNIQFQQQMALMHAQQVGAGIVVPGMAPLR